MYPIPSERKLSVVEIAKHWSREIDPPALAQELRDVISKAWWRGELIATNAPSRLSVLRYYYLKSAKFIAFAIPNTEEPPQWVPDEDGAIEFVRPLRVPLPNANPEIWTEADCAPAFDAIAEQWNEALISPSPSAPLYLPIVLTSSEFFEWIDTIGYKRPTFWSCPFDEHSEQRRATDGTVPRIEITKEQPKGKKSCAAWKAINSLWPDGPQEYLQTAHIHREVNKWIKKQQPREKYPFTEVSREVVARLLHRK
jgi:hypothetical protein